MTEHELKTWPDYFTLAANGAKCFELRYNDRGFTPGDNLLLREYDKDRKVYSGRALRGRVTFILPLSYFIPDVDPLWVIMSVPNLKLVFVGVNGKLNKFTVYTNDLNDILTGKQPFVIAHDELPQLGQEIVIAQNGSAALAIVTAIQPIRVSKKTVYGQSAILGIKNVSLIV